MFLILLLSVTVTVWLFLSLGFIRHLNMSQIKKTTLHLLLALTVILSIGGQFFIRRQWIHVNEQWFGYAAWFVYIAMGFLSLLFFCALAARIALWVANRVRTDEPETDLTRRGHIRKTLGAAAFATAAASTGYGVKLANGEFDVTTLSMLVPHLPESLRKLRIVQISDLHIGPLVQKEFVRRLVESVNKLKADIFVITGDLGDGDPEVLAEHIKPLERVVASIGRLYVTGNHEYYWGGQKWIKHMEQAGYIPLLNKYVLCGKNGIDKILVAGIPDFTAKRLGPEHAPDIQKALRNPHFDFDSLTDAQRSGFVKILLAHRPSEAELAAKLGFDIQLSGHTHAGQYFPFTLIVHAFHKYVSGFHWVKRLQLYVNRGTGYWGPPIRLRSLPEITVIELENRDE